MKTLKEYGNATLISLELKLIYGVGNLKECYEEAKQLLTNNRDVLDKIAHYLYDHETITGKEFMEIYNRAKGITVSDDTDSSENSEENVDEFGPMEDSLQVDDLKKLDGVDI